MILNPWAIGTALVACGALAAVVLRLWRALGEEEQTAAMRRLAAIRRKQG